MSLARREPTQNICTRLFAYFYPKDGIPTLGDQYAAASKEDGRGFYEVFKKAAETAKEANSKVCLYNFWLQKVCGIFDFELFQKLMKEFHDSLAAFDFSPIYYTLFGPSLLSEPKESPIYKADREYYEKRLMDHKKIGLYGIQVEAIAKQHINAIQNGKIKNLGKFCSNLALDFIVQTQLGIKELSQSDKDKLEELIKSVTAEITRISVLAHFNMPEILKSCVGSRDAKKLKQIISEGRIFLKGLVEKNLKHIAESDNILKERFGTKKEDLLSERCLQNFSLVLFAGAESTAKSLETSIRLIADVKHKAIKEDLIKQIAAAKDDKATIPETLKKIPLLNQVMRESLRLYPPFPIFKDQVKKDITITLQDNPKKTITLSKGTMIFYSPLEFMRSPAAHGKNALDFVPGRELIEGDPARKFPVFGFAPRLCIGRFLALIEGQIFLKEMLSRFDLELECASSHPYPTEMVYSLRFLDEASIKVTAHKVLDDKAVNVITNNAMVDAKQMKK